MITWTEIVIIQGLRKEEGIEGEGDDSIGNSLGFGAELEQVDDVNQNINSFASMIFSGVKGYIYIYIYY